MCDIKFAVYVFYALPAVAVAILSVATSRAFLAFSVGCR